MTLSQHRVSTYGGENNTVQHWQLRCYGRFVADTSSAHEAEHFQRIVDALNQVDSRDEQGAHEHTWVDQYGGRVFRNIVDASDNVIYQKCSGCDGTRTVRVVAA